MNKHRFRRHRPLFNTSVPKAVIKPKIKWKILPILWMALKRMCMALGFMVLISSVWGTYLALNIMQSGVVQELPDEMVLYIKFKNVVNELSKETNFLDPFSKSPPTVRELVLAIDKAKDDARVKGLFVRLDGARFSIAHVQELRNAIKHFRSSGKFAYIYSPSYGDAGGGFGGYYLASSFDEIWMQPMGVVMINGLNAESPYFREMLDKIGIEPQFFQRKEYKTAYENMIHKEMTKQNREMISTLLEDIRSVFIKDIPIERGITSAQFEAFVNKGLFTAKEAQDIGLITDMNYADILVGNIKENVTGDRDFNDDLFISISHYNNSIQKSSANSLLKNVPLPNAGKKKSKIALVYAVGAIMPSKTGVNAPVFIGGNIAAADKIAPAIIKAGEDKDIKAIILRIDSPGGSPTASESILHALERAQKNGKPVIVSMGSTAASGGYWIAAYADRIFALPTTITGSIGVIGGKFTAGAFWDKLGVNWDGVKWGDNSGMWSINTPYSKNEAERINMMLDQVYEGFLERVSKGRGMSIEAVDNVAGGRVWSGARALDVGLVDELGGLMETLNYTAKLLGEDDKNDLDVVLYPAPKTPLEQFLSLIEDSSSVYEGMKWQNSVMQFFAPFLQQIAIMQNRELITAYEPMSID
ncbi:MAG: signal peptide peptidase SppA [Alphaproteobacteria bacterium]|nr:signal peptide peptidase SppA [Alphaproteobacteria bacterium]